MSIHLNYYNYCGNYIWLGINYLYFKDKKKYWKLWKNVLFLLHFSKDLYSRKDMNLARFNIVPIVQFVDDAHALINGGNFHRFNILHQ